MTETAKTPEEFLERIKENLTRFKPKHDKDRNMLLITNAHETEVLPSLPHHVRFQINMNTISKGNDNRQVVQIRVSERAGGMRNRTNRR